MEVAEGRNDAILDHGQLLRQVEHFIDGVADVDHRHLDFFLDPAQERQDLPLESRIQRGHRFIQQQQLRRSQNGPPQGDALLFPTGKLMRFLVQKATQLQQLDNLCHLKTPRVRLQQVMAVGEVGSYRQVREQSTVLKHHADAALVHRNIDAARAVQ